MLKECVLCEAQFDPRSPAKQRAGGHINKCPDCSEESTVRYLGLANGDGKQASITILSFKTQRDKESYESYWKSNTGFYKGKSCHLSQSNVSNPGVSFKTVFQSGSTNHKGKSL